MRFWAILGVAVLLVMAAVFLLRDLPPPDRITFAAGARDGGYWEIAQRYRSVLARDGIEVEVIETAGSVENLGLLTTGEADVGLLQGGIPATGLEIEALGAVFQEPLVVFVRKAGGVPPNPALWSGLTIARGTQGSGTRVAVDGLLDALGVADRNRFVEIDGSESARALLDGDIDVAAFVAPLQAEYLQGLYRDETVTLLRFDHAEAIALRLPHSRIATVPSGAISLDPVLPSRPVPMITLMARLAAIDDLHPAIVDRLVFAARQIHGNKAVLAQQGQFPSAVAADMPIDAGAMKLLIEGQSAFHDWLPYWIAAQIRRVLLVVLPLVIIVIPLVRVLPEVYRWSMRRRVWRYYGEVHQIEMEVGAASCRDDLEALDRRLVALDERLSAMRLPGPFRDGAYNARLHVEMVRRRIADLLSVKATT